MSSETRPGRFNPLDESDPQITFGVSEQWVDALIKVNTAIPQGFPAMDYYVTPTILESIIIGDLNWEQLYNLRLSKDQASRFKQSGNDRHTEHRVARKVDDEDIKLIWFRTSRGILLIAGQLLRWQDEELYGSQAAQSKWPYVGGRLVGIDLNTAQRLSAMFSDKDQSSKVGTLFRLAHTAAASLGSDSSKSAVSRHIDLALHDPTYSICAQDALDPLYENVVRSVKQEAEIIQSEKNIKVPDYLIDKFS